ncbi:hypothetical protein Golomagni_06724 [Golovinomyces magnicellulatus]|nr:hypothetical protein Golomagni_06724 [Golovinomyces magnicellulatus]
MDQNSSMDHGTSPDGDGRQTPGQQRLYRLDSNHSVSSIFEDVEMAHEELFAGPVAESLPTSVSAFSHRRRRADSTTSFTYYDEEAEDEAISENSDEYAPSERARHSSTDEIGDIDFDDVLSEEDSPDRRYSIAEEDYPLRRRSSTHSNASVHAHLLRRSSNATVGSTRGLGRTSQKVYMANEDLTIAIAGFRTSTFGYAAYLTLCLVTFGIAYLVFRWLPRWYVAVLGQTAALKDCEWVVIENQWAEFAILDVQRRPFDRPVSTVFGVPEKLFSYGLDDENDPIMADLRTLDYRYVRLFFHPLKDKFSLGTGWKDPDWTDVRLVRSGLDSDEKSVREIIFGSNLIDIEQKSTRKLLVDEVSYLCD